MASVTKNFGVVLLDPNQASKDVTVNEALVVFDNFVQPSIISASLTTPPTSPSDQDKYIVPANATGVWANQTNNVAVYQANGSLWLFFVPRSGWVVYDQALTSLLVWDSITVTWGIIGTVSGTLAAIAALTPTNGSLIVGTGTSWVTETPFQAVGPTAAMLALIYGG